MQKILGKKKYGVFEEMKEDEGKEKMTKDVMAEPDKDQIRSNYTGYGREFGFYLKCNKKKKSLKLVKQGIK